VWQFENCYTLVTCYLIGPRRPSNQVICLPVPCTAIAILVVCRRRRPSECHADYKVWNGGSILPTKLVATATSLEGSKKITSDCSYTAKVLPILQSNFAKIGQADVEIVRLTEKMTKMYKISHPRLRKQTCSLHRLRYCRNRNPQEEKKRRTRIRRTSRGIHRAVFATRRGYNNNNNNNNNGKPTSRFPRRTWRPLPVCRRRSLDGPRSVHSLLPADECDASWRQRRPPPSNKQTDK